MTWMRMAAPLLLVGLVTACAEEGLQVQQSAPVAQADESKQERQAAFAADLKRGEALFEGNCVVCHGVQAAGTQQGPPLVHKIYEPSHHADVAFFMAMRDGVRAHHWQFGDMPPVPGLEVEDMAQIIVYLRALQREAGIY